MESARTVPDDFPTDGVELSYFLVVSDYARALAFYRDVLGATVVRELPGTLGFLNFRGSQILLSAPGGSTKDHAGAELPGYVRGAALPRSRVYHPTRRVGRRDPGLLPRP